MTETTLDAWLSQASIPELAAALTRVSARLLEFGGAVPPGGPVDGEGLKKLREILGFTQAGAAQVLGASVRTVQRWEYGLARLDPLRGGAVRQRLYEAARLRQQVGV